MLSLRQRRAHPDVADRLREWRRSLSQFLLACGLGVLLLALHLHGGSFESAMRDLEGYAGGAFILALLLVRKGVRRLPAFLLES